MPTKDFLLNNIVWFMLIALVVLFSLMNQYFFTAANFQNILTQATVLGLLALAAALPLLVGEIDLSIAGNLGLSSAIGALASIELGLPTFAGVGVGVAFATLVGFINGLCVTKLRMVSLIETLGMMIILQGALLAITKGSTIISFSDAYIWVGQATILGGWPVMPFFLLAAFILMGIVLKRTVFGRKLYATGGNTDAAFVAGIRIDRIKIAAFTLSGMIAGIAGYFLASWQIAIVSDQGSGFLLYSIAAPILGGISVFGGRGQVWGILGGVFLLTIIQTGLSIVNVPSFYVEMIGGVLIFIAVAVDALRVGANGRR
ncbi:ABC transporter permease [Pacificoceanicola onchidii]|uniref:ABC transporter permease n=1 Tax=Pacificoceanicola onchidii TaxID=2562685 RepID=UPI001F0DA951|nr:ABC transporter permease [Pacificoceanicola onchidii]